MNQSFISVAFKLFPGFVTKMQKWWFSNIIQPKVFVLIILTAGLCLWSLFYSCGICFIHVCFIHVEFVLFMWNLFYSCWIYFIHVEFVLFMWNCLNYVVFGLFMWNLFYTLFFRPCNELSVWSLVPCYTNGQKFNPLTKSAWFSRSMIGGLKIVSL